MNFSTFFLRKNRVHSPDAPDTGENDAKSGSGLQAGCRLLLFVLLPAVCFYLMEFYEHNPFAEVRTEAQLFNILLMELLAWILFLLLGSGRWAIRILGFMAMVFGLVNHYVMVFRSTPFVPWDILSIGTAASVAGNYDFTPDARVVIVTLLFCAMFFLLHFFRFSWKKMIYIRLLPMALMVWILCLFVNLLQDEDFQTRHYLYPFLFTPAYMTQVNGMAVTFAMDLAYVNVEKPAGYRAEECRELLEAYEDAGTAEVPENGELPNIIVIMDEAFSDLAVLGEVGATEDYMPFMHSLQQGQENTVTGYLNVSVCGGNTANTEFEFLTGNTMAFLPAGSIPYQQYLKSEVPSLAEHLSKLGYATYAMHPYYASGWCRDSVYPWMGFENTCFLPDYTNIRYVRKYVSDETDMEKIISTYENKPKGQPLFIFNVTMQNHGGYTEEYPDFQTDITVPGANNPALDQYLSLIRLTDADLENLIDYFSGQEEKTVIVFFGDHQPSDTVAKSVFAAEGEEYLRYEVPYVIWANYDIEEASGADTSANYLAAHVLKTAGVPVSAYQNFLLELEQNYPVISAVRTECSEEEEALFNTYRKLQYYQLFDWKGEQNE